MGLSARKTDNVRMGVTIAVVFRVKKKFYRQWVKD